MRELCVAVTMLCMQVQKITDDYIRNIEELIAVKERELQAQ